MSPIEFVFVEWVRPLRMTREGESMADNQKAKHGDSQSGQKSDHEKMGQKGNQERPSGEGNQDSRFGQGGEGDQKQGNQQERRKP